MSSFFDFHDRLKQRPEKAPPASAKPISVSELTRQIDKAIKGSLPATVHVRGEISNYKHHAASGNVYFTLKDADACIDCVMFKSDRGNLKFEPTDGMELIVTGRVAVYAQRGKYQLYASQLQPLGVGALELAFKQLHAKLLAEGLFAPERKRAIPKYPQCIGIVTSTQTAAIQDMLKVLRRFTFLKICIYHASVQGDGSAEKIAAAIAQLNRRTEVEVILLGRGGGSLEDLWEFNEECVARAIFGSRIPIVTGIGHEIDVSIADLVADHHAHTPTEAAQVVTGHWRHAAQIIETSAARLGQGLKRMEEILRHRLTSIERHEIFRRPMDRINTLRQLLDEQQRHLYSAEHRVINHHRQRLDRLAVRAAEKHPRHRLQLANQQLQSTQKRLAFSMRCELDRRGQKLEAFAAHLSAIAPQQVLRRGYSITRLKKIGAILRSTNQVSAGQRLITELADGKIESITADANQPELFE